MRQHLAAITATIGAPPRNWDAGDRAYLRIGVSLGYRLLTFLTFERLMTIIKVQNVIWDTGRPVWSYVVFANDKIYQPGQSHVLPAYVLYGLDDSLLDDVEPLVMAATAIQQAHPDVARLTTILNEGMERPVKMKVAESVSGGANIFLTTLWLVPKHLPEGYLQQPIIPILASSQTEYTAAVPSRYWPSEFAAQWTE